MYVCSLKICKNVNKNKPKKESRLRMKKLIMLVCGLLVSMISAKGIITKGPTDPFNTNIPPNLDEVLADYGQALVAIIGSNAVIGATHTLTASDRVTYQGIDYPVIGSTNVAFDVSVVFIEGSFPSNTPFAKFYEGSDYEGMEITMVGKGGARGAPINTFKVVEILVTNEVTTLPTNTMIANFVRNPTTSTNTFSVIGDPNSEFMVDQTTDLNSWVATSSDVYTFSEQGSASITLVSTNDSMFYRVMSLPKVTRTVTTEIVTNVVTIGWELTGHDNVRRCGKNTLNKRYEGEWYLNFTFDWWGDDEEALATDGDSGSPAFNEAGEVVGIFYGWIPGPFSNDSGLTWFYGNMMNLSGLSFGFIDENGNFVESLKYPEGSGGVKGFYVPFPVDVVKNLAGR